MVNVKPGRPRAVTTSVPGGIRIAVPTQKNVFALVFLPVWLTFWAFGEVVAIGALFGAGTAHSSRPPPAGFLAFWLAAWTVGGALALASFL